MIDLHTHSTASDGSLAPAALVRSAHDIGLAAIALTDHDTVAGVAEARSAAADLPLTFVPGVELSSRFADRTPHLVGLHVDERSPALTECLDLVRAMRARRNPKLAARLAEIGYPVDLDEIERRVGDGVVGRPHFASAMVRRGYVADTDEAFDRFLDNGKAAHVPKERLDAADAIAAIRAAGGVPILAHPELLKLDDEATLRFVGGLVELGLAGIEVYCAGHCAQATERYTRLAKRYNLVRSGGSDFHGDAKPELELGRADGALQVPDALLEPIAAAAAEIRKATQ